MPGAGYACIFGVVGGPYRICETDKSVEELETGDESTVLVIRRIRWRRSGKWAIFFMLWRESRPVTGIPRIFEHATVIVITVVELIEYWVTSLEVLAGSLYGQRMKR